MAGSLFTQQLLFLDQSLDDYTAFFDFVFPHLQQQGYVQPSFLPAIKAREAQFPTALPTQPVAIAIPHTDIEHVIKPFISVTRLTQPIAWREMANDDNQLMVQFIFLLGFTDTNGHIELLQMLLSHLCQAEFLQQLQQAKTAESFLALLNSGIKQSNQ